MQGTLELALSCHKALHAEVAPGFKHALRWKMAVVHCLMFVRQRMWGKPNAAKRDAVAVI